MLSARANVVAIDYFLHPKEVVSLWRGEVIPESFDIGFDKLGRLDRDWIWIAKKGGEVVGVLVTSPCHGIAVIWRIAVSKEASSACVLKLLRQFMRDAAARNLAGYMTLVTPAQAKLQQLMEAHGAAPHGEFTMMSSPLTEVR